MMIFAAMDIPMVAEVNFTNQNQRVIALAHYDFGVLEGLELEYVDATMLSYNFESVGPMIYRPFGRTVDASDEYEQKRSHKTWVKYQHELFDNPDAV